MIKLFFTLFFYQSKKVDDRHELTKQILEITQRRMSLQTELTLLEEENEDLKVNRVLSIKDHIRSLYVGTLFHFSLTFAAFHFFGCLGIKKRLNTNKSRRRINYYERKTMSLNNKLAKRCL